MREVGAGADMNMDVVIVGGGAVGASLALALARLDYRVALIELRSPQFGSSDPERVIALNYGSRVHLERLGVWDAIVAGGVGRIRHITVSEAGQRGRVELDAADAGQGIDGLGYVVEMGKLLAPIYAELPRAGVTVMTETVVEDFAIDAEKVVLTGRRGGAPFEVAARLLVAGDGTQSQMRRLAGIDTFGWDYNRFGIVASVACAQGHRETAHECFRNSGPLAFLPLADDRYSIVWAAAPAEAAQLLQMDDGQFLHALQRAAGAQVIERTGALLSVSKRASYPLELTIAKQFAKPRFALVGNALHTIHPVAGQGMNLGFRDVDALLEVLAGDLARRDPGATILMQGYAEKRRVDLAAVAGFTESMSHIFGSTLPGVKWLRGVGLRRLPQLPSLRDLLIQQASGMAQMKRVGLRPSEQAGEVADAS